MDTRRLQVDLSEAENNLMERLSKIAGFKTKREFVINSMALMQWAANELASGNAIASVGRIDKAIKQLEMPCLQAFARLAEDFDRLAPSAEEILRRANTPGRPVDEVIDELKRNIEELEHEASGSTHKRSQRVAG